MNDLINLLSMNKEQVYAFCFPKYKALKNSGHYRELLISEKERLTELKKSYSNNMDFYNFVALEFTNKYIDIMIKEYSNKISQEKIDKLNKLKTKEGIRILKPGEAAEIGLVKKNKDGSTVGSVSAFAKENIICFTPEFEDYMIDTSNFTHEQKDELAVKNALRMMGTMIHETFHLIIDVRDEKELFEWTESNENHHIHGPAGFILNEAIVEKYAIDFASKYKLPQNPALYYLHYVDFYNEVCAKDNSFNVFEDDYKKILSKVLNDDELNLYRYNERVKCLSQFHNTNNVKININDISKNNIVK